MKRSVTILAVFFTLILAGIPSVSAKKSDIVGGSFKVNNPVEDVIVTALGKDALHEHFLSAS